MPDNNLHIGDYTLQCAGSIILQGYGDEVGIDAAGLESGLRMSGATSATLQSGAAVLCLSNTGVEIGTAVLTVGEVGTVQIGCGVPLVGANIILEPEAISITCGAPGAGASIKMTPESITFQVAEVTMTITPAGIVEEVAECSREHTPEGHNMVAAETEFNVGVQGETKELPTEESEVEGGTVDNETMGSHTSDAMRNEDAGVMMTV